MIVVDADQVLIWLMSLADKAGYSDRAAAGVQIVVEQPFGADTTVHSEIPSLTFMLSNIPGSRKSARRQA